MMIAAVRALEKVFSNRAPIDTETLTGCVEKMAKLLDLPFMEAVKLAIRCFTSMTNKMPEVVFAMYDLGLFPTVVGMLSNPALVGAVLPLVGNLALGEAAHVETLIECDLFGVLRRIGLADSHAADVLWALSNLVESVPRLAGAFLDSEFVAALFATAGSAKYAVMKEAGFLIATLIVVADEATLEVFERPEVIDLLGEMLECSVATIVVRCLDAIMKLARAGRAYELAKLEDPLRDLLLQSSAVISEKAEVLLAQI
jgi:hypothetical protein